MLQRTRATRRPVSFCPSCGRRILSCTGRHFMNVDAVHDDITRYTYGCFLVLGLWMLPCGHATWCCTVHALLGSGVVSRTSSDSKKIGSSEKVP